MQIQIGRKLASVLCFALTVLLAPDAKGADQTSTVSPIPIPAADVKWINLDPSGAPGVKVAILWGDHRSGAFGAIFQAARRFFGPATCSLARHEAGDCVRNLHSRARRQAGVSTGGGLLLDATRRQLLAYDQLRSCVGVSVFCRKQWRFRSSAGQCERYRHCQLAGVPRSVKTRTFDR